MDKRIQCELCSPIVRESECVLCASDENPVS